MVDVWNFLDLPTTLNNVMFHGTAAGLITAQLMLTAFLAMVFILPAMFARQKPDVVIALAIFAILIATGLTWLPPAIMVVLVFLIALAWAGYSEKPWPGEDMAGSGGDEGQRRDDEGSGLRGRVSGGRPIPDDLAQSDPDTGEYHRQQSAVDSGILRYGHVQLSVL